MLVLSRKPGDGLDIGDTVRVTVLSVDKNQVKIGIEAPKETTILRCELKEKKK